MSIAHDLFGQFSIGEENAVTSHLLWKHLGMWSPARIKQRLNEMAADVIDADLLAKVVLRKVRQRFHSTFRTAADMAACQ